MNNKGNGSGGNLEGNSIAIIMEIVAIIADIALGGYIISANKRSDAKSQRNNSTLFSK